MSHCQRALTLLELLTAISLLAIISTSACFWIISQGRASHAAQSRLGTAALASALQRLLNDDLVLSVPDAMGHHYTLVDDHTLALSTLDRLPGESAGFHTVTWRFDPATHRLMRTVAGTITPNPIAPIAEGGANVAFVAGSSGRLTLHCTDSLGGDWALPLWTEGH
jgi:prepilin-type N-terminal cleavage/methylation domain-containing protein